MQIQLTWQETGDTIYFDAINEDVVSWFIAKSQSIGENKYYNGDQAVDRLRSRTHTDKLIQEEKSYIDAVNQALAKLKMPLFMEPNDYCDQKQLNRLHKDWAESRQKWPRLTELFYKIDKNLFEAYQEMNCHIHFIEQSFQYRFRDRINWRTSNPFKDIGYNWEESHLYIEYPGHGRAAFEKFVCLDDDDDFHRDNVNWDNIDAVIGIKLMRPYRENPPPEFLSWCAKHNVIPHRNKLPLANLTNWKENLTRARQLFSRNVIIEENYFTLEIIN